MSALKPVLPEIAWAAVSPWSRRPFVVRGMRFNRKGVVAHLNEVYGVEHTLAEWQQQGWRFVKCEVKPL
jgi:hypothetical protein